MTDNGSADGLLVWSTAGATVGLVVKDGVVVGTPPYAHRWAYGHSARDLWREAKRRNVDVVWIPRPPGEPWGQAWERTTSPSRFERPPGSST